MRRKINIAILAHIDAGKTTLTEQILFAAGSLKHLGNVDKGTASTDFLQVERDRGISVMASHTSVIYKEVQINIIDTPGHADFISEVERSLLAVDAVILLISAADGVQSQTRVLWSILEKHKIPRFIVINKMDRVDVFVPTLIQEIKTELNTNCVPMQQVIDEGTDRVEVKNFRSTVTQQNISFSDEAIERLAGLDDELLAHYLDEEKELSSLLFSVYHRNILEAKVFPILFSVAKNSIGVEYILQHIISVFKFDEQVANDSFSAIVFKISHHPVLGLLSHIRVFFGKLIPKQLVFNQRLQREEKVNQIKAVYIDKLEDVNLAEGGDIVAVSGLAESRVGDVLGYQELQQYWDFNTIPLLTVRVKPKSDQNYSALSVALKQLSIEDPLLNFQWLKEEKEFHIKINGWIQIEILQQLLRDRFSLETDFVSPSVIYKETPKEVAIGYDAYTMPKPCWAVIKLQIEPGERGSGVVFESRVGVNEVLLKYQKEVERSIHPALMQGIKGWEVTDLKIIMIAGEDHVIHSRAGDFVIATPMALMNGLQNADTHLLEPIMKFELRGPEGILGKITSDLIQMRATFGQPEIEAGKIVLKGNIPLASSIDYPVKLASRTGGKAFIQLQFNKYEIVDDSLGKIRDYKGISPLDRAKYILKVRKAIK